MTIENSHFESLYPETTRFTEIERILTFVKEGNSCELVGIPGAGRSNIFGLLAYNKKIRLKHLGENQKWFHFIPVDFSEIRKRPLSDAIKFLFLNLIDSLRQRQFEEEFKNTNGIFRASLNLKDELVLFQGLKRAIDYLAIEKELTVVFLFDRFEEYIPMLTPEFFSDLRILRNRAKYRFSVVFSLNRPLEELIEPALFADFYEYLAGHTMYLSLLDKPGLTFRKAYLEKVSGKTIEEALFKRILTATNGHAKLTKLSMEAVLARGQGESVKGKEQTSSSFLTLNASPFPLSQFLLSQKTILGALYEIWYSLRPSEQYAILNNTPRPDALYLEYIHIMHDKRITIPLFQAFVTTLIKTRVEKESISLDPHTGDVLKGATPISDELTTSEFRLLQFFLQNPDKIVSREEVIQAVWHDAKTTAGVSDQALDQLIFRLRRKIETDPNNPTHLQTVKGRGFRFVP